LAVGADLPGGGEPVHPRHLDVEDGEVGGELADQLDGFVAPAGLPHDLVALLLEGLLQVEADDGLVFGDDDTGAHRGVLSEGDGGGQGLASAVSRSRSSSWVASRRAISAASSARCRAMASAW